jgi:DNA polymerase III delta subunit
MLILHGENIVQSRNALFQTISTAKTDGKEVVTVVAKSLTLPILEEALGATSLFGGDRVVVIEDLHSLPKSKKKDELIAFVSASIANNTAELILWEKRQVTATMLKKFAGAKSQEFKVTNKLFQWLDSLTGQKTSATLQNMLSLLQEALKTDGDFMCLSLLGRQVRLLIETKEGSTASMAPFMLAKLQKQAQSFTLEQLLTLHHRLLLIDIGQKTSSSRLGLGQELELLMVEM